MGKCAFRGSWLTMEEFSSWIQRIPDRYSFRCRLCMKSGGLGTMGVLALRSHASGQGHKKALANLNRSTTITSFVRTPSVNTPRPVSVSDLVGTSKPSLKSEVLWSLHTVHKHSPYNSSDNISALFQSMFPDSQIAQKFSYETYACTFC